MSSLEKFLAFLVQITLITLGVFVFSLRYDLLPEEVAKEVNSYLNLLDLKVNDTAIGDTTIAQEISTISEGVSSLTSASEQVDEINQLIDELINE